MFAFKNTKSQELKPVIYLTKPISSKAIQFYVAALIASNIVFFSHFLPLWWWAFGLLEVVLFFNYANKFTRTWSKYSVKAFEKKLFQQGFIIRVVWVLFAYVFYNMMTGKPFEFSAGDSFYYNNLGNSWAARSFNLGAIVKDMGVSDSGYVIYLSILKRVLGQDIIITRIIKSALGAYTSVLMYRLGTRTFNEEIGRITGIFCMLMPNLIYYCGLHLKEVEMVFLTVLFLERTDYLMRTRVINFINVSIPIFAALFLFFFRTALGGTAIVALFTALMFSSTKVLGMGKRMILIVWALVMIFYFLTGNITSEIQYTWNNKENDQVKSMNWRAEQENGNKYAKYMGAAVFAPLIVAIPFPTVVNIKEQDNQMLINGGNYVKNVMAFFVIIAIFYIIKSKKWRDYLLVGSFFLGYLAVLAKSSFAQSERFHQPIMPLLMMFAAYGLSQLNAKNKRYLNWYFIVLFFVIIGWSWFKLSGRGLA